MEYNNEHEVIVEGNDDEGWVDTHHNVDFNKLQDEVKEMTVSKEVCI